MKKNIYWSVYKNLERELNSLAESIHIDDKQLTVYSIKISELIIRCNVEIESISKDLYFETGGIKENGKDLFYDTDCIKHLEDEWKLSKKIVNVSSVNLYLEKEENKALTPLHKAFKRGRGSDWKNAYQALKHDRSGSLKKGNFKHLIRSMAALYLLNIYYRDLAFDFGIDSNGSNFNPNLGSSIFSVKLHSNTSINLETDYVKNEDYDECSYLLRPTDETRQIVQETISAINTETNEIFEERLMKDTMKEFLDHTFTEDDIIAKLNEAKIIAKKKLTIETTRRNEAPLKKVYNQVKYIGELNKQQY